LRAALRPCTPVPPGLAMATDEVRDLEWQGSLALAATTAQGGAEGLQYLCTKYSSLITRLREEVLGRQRAEEAAQHVQGRLREEASTWQHQRLSWDAERRALHDELSALQAQKHQAEENSAAAGRQLAERCERLQEACVEEAHKSVRVLDQAAAGGETMRRQGEALVQMRHEHCELQARHRTMGEELMACREHLTRWRSKATEMETKVDEATHGREEADGRSRLLQEEMRQALRSASAARTREQSAAQCADRGERELRARDMRLTAVRREGQRHARRASSAERRLAAAGGCEAAVERLQWQAAELRTQLTAESNACETARLERARAEAAATRAAAAATEARSELRVGEAGSSAVRTQAADREQQLDVARGRLQQLELERVANANAMGSLRSELLTCQNDREEARCEQHRLIAELAESKRRWEKGHPKLAESRRRLGGLEEAVARAQAEVAEERKARERCHLEAIRSADKLRAARSQGQQLRERIRALEENELRYPSRQLREAEQLLPDAWLPAASGEGLPHHHHPAVSSSSTAARCTSEPELRRGEGRRYPSGADCGNEAVFDFIATEDQRLVAPSGSTPPGRALGRGAGGGAQPLTVAGSWEEQPRATAPAKASLGLSLGRDHLALCSAAGPGAVDPELAALLAAEPRVLQQLRQRGERMEPSEPGTASRSGGA